MKQYENSLRQNQFSTIYLCCTFNIININNINVMKETILTALLRRCKTEKIYEDSIFLEYQFNDLYLTIFATKEDNFKISELFHSEEIKITKKQKEYLQKLVYSKVVKVADQIDEYFENGVRPENFY